MNAPLFPEWTVVIGFILGAFFGSFLNMVIYRLPRGLSFNEPKRSFCPKCKHQLDWIDLMPLVSWASTGGKCRYCKDPIAVRYELVELLNGLLFAGIWWRFMLGPSPPSPHVADAVCYAIAACLLVAIIFIDWELFIIPDELNALLLIVGLVLAGIKGEFRLAVEGALLGWAVIWGMQLLGRIAFRKDAMGDGDIKMMRGVGALIGPLLLLANLGIAVFLGLLGGIAGMLVAARLARAEGGNQGAKDQGSNEEDEAYTPTPVWVVLFCGLWYLLCLDVFALVVKPLANVIHKILPPEALEEEDDWTPSPTTIPFGPYLATGALVCMLFGPTIERSMLNYWSNATGQRQAESVLEVGPGRTIWTLAGVRASGPQSGLYSFSRQEQFESKCRLLARECGGGKSGILT